MSDLSDSNEIIENDDVKESCKKAALYEINYYKDKFNNDTVTLNDILFLIDNDNKINANNLKKFILHIRAKNKIKFNTINLLDLKDLLKYVIPITRSAYTVLIANESCIKNISSDSTDDLGLSSVRQQKVPRVIKINEDNINYLIKDDNIKNFCIEASLYEIRHIIHSSLLNMSLTNILYNINIKRINNAYNLKKLLLHIRDNNILNPELLDNTTLDGLFTQLAKTHRLISNNEYNNIIDNNRCIQEIPRSDIPQRKILRSELQRQEIPQLSNTSDYLITDDATKKICIKAALYEMKNNIIPNFANHHLKSVILNKDTTLEDLMTLPIVKYTNSYSLEKLLLHLQAKYIYSKQYFEGLTIKDFLDVFDKHEYIMDYEEYRKNMCISMPRPVIGGKKTKYSINNDTKTNRAYIKYNNKKVYFYKNDNYKIFIEIDKKIISITKKIFGYNNSKNNYYINI